MALCPDVKRRVFALAVRSQPAGEVIHPFGAEAVQIEVQTEFEEGVAKLDRVLSWVDTVELNPERR